MPHNLIFLGLHFVISKCEYTFLLIGYNSKIENFLVYSNTFLATLNTRDSLRGKSRKAPTLPRPADSLRSSFTPRHGLHFDSQSYRNLSPTPATPVCV